MKGALQHWRHSVLATGLALYGLSSMAAIVLPHSDGGGGDAGSAAAPAAQPSGGAGGSASIRVPAPSRSEASLQVLRRQAQEGDSRAQVELGLYYYRNAGLPQAGAQARQWWGMAAAQGDARAMAGLGYMLGTGSGGVRDVPTGRQWLQRASESGLSKANYLLSLVERRMTGPKAAQQARLLLEQAAREGDAMALNDMAVERELDGRMAEAKELYVQAVAKGSQTAQQNLNRLANYQRASESEQLARLRARADDGSADALLELAYRYHLGRGVQRNFATAIQYYRRAADAGSSKAREFLGLIFSRSNEKQAVIDEAWMQELAARINAVALKVEEKAPAQLPDRPVRVADPLADLLRQAFVMPEAPTAPQAEQPWPVESTTDTNSPSPIAVQTEPTEGPQAPARLPGAPASDDASNALLSQ